VTIAVLDYGIGNLRSAEKALQHVGADARLMVDSDEVKAANGVVLPGVGAFGSCASALEASGLKDAALDAIARGVPFLGICVGFQLLYAGSEESPGACGLGVFDGVVRRLPRGVKHPQMQWNRLQPVDPGRGLDELCPTWDPEPWVYFVHSYAPAVGPETVAVCDYGTQVAAAAHRGQIWGTQFHPEKSGEVGLAMLATFVERCATSTRAASPA
jgi:imidazole glycerol-phosphate synthase subunit HisH